MAFILQAAVRKVTELTCRSKKTLTVKQPSKEF